MKYLFLFIFLIGCATSKREMYIKDLDNDFSILQKRFLDCLYKEKLKSDENIHVSIEVALSLNEKGRASRSRVDFLGSSQYVSATLTGCIKNKVDWFQFTAPPEKEWDNKFYKVFHLRY